MAYEEAGVNISHENRNFSKADPEKFKTFPNFLKNFLRQITVNSSSFRRFFNSFTKASVNYYTQNTQLHHWNELSSQKKRRKF